MNTIEIEIPRVSGVDNREYGSALYVIDGDVSDANANIYGDGHALVKFVFFPTSLLRDEQG